VLRGGKHGQNGMRLAVSALAPSSAEETFSIPTSAEPRGRVHLAGLAVRPHRDFCETPYQIDFSRIGQGGTRGQGTVFDQELDVCVAVSSWSVLDQADRSSRSIASFSNRTMSVNGQSLTGRKHPF
jgi:hypothetical protein